MDFAGIEKLSLVDFDNHLSCTLFTAGCDLRCPFCHNRDLVIRPDLAPTIPWEEIVAFLDKRRMMLDAVVVTGGEPTLMPDLLDKLREIKAMGYKIKLDTNGNHPSVLGKILDEGLVDYVAMDIKNSMEKYAATAGLKSFDPTKIRESIAMLIDRGVDHEFRTTAMEEFHTSKDFEDIAHEISGAKRYFIQFYRDKESCIEHGFHPLSKEKALHAKAIMESFGVPTSLRGFDL